ncbi:MAG: DUF4349 domain-containing protein [Proteobacteria bacterium]|nr:DUF4349 domain-containing protein [Pseudomonadota bacterium]
MKKLLLVLLATMALAGCWEDENSVATSESANYMGGGMVMAKSASPQAAMAYSDGMVAQAAPPSSMVLDRRNMGDKKIAETHNLQIETEFDQLQARYQRDFAKCAELGCQVLNSNITAEQGGNLSARISPDKLGAFLDFLATGEGEIKNHNVSADDYTMEYSDTVAQTENLLALRERLRSLLASPKAEKVDDILRIEQELNRVQTEIDQRSARLKILQKMTALATVNIEYAVKYRPAEIRPYELNNTWKIAANKFMRGIDAMIQFTGATLPWVPVFFVGLWLMVRVVRFAFGKINLRLPWKR